MWKLSSAWNSWSWWNFPRRICKGCLEIAAVILCYRTSSNGKLTDCRLCSDNPRVGKHFQTTVPSVWLVTFMLLLCLILMGRRALHSSGVESMPYLGHLQLSLVAEDDSGYLSPLPTVRTCQSLFVCPAPAQVRNTGIISLHSLLVTQQSQSWWCCWNWSLGWAWQKVPNRALIPHYTHPSFNSATMWW